MIHLPKQTAAVVDPDVTGQIDIMPSVADLLGLSLANTPHFGRSAFRKTSTMLTRPSTVPTYIDDNEMYLRGVTDGEDRWYSSTTQQPREQGVVPQRFANTAELLKLSDAYTMSLPGRLSALEATGVIPTLGRDVSKTPFR